MPARRRTQTEPPPSAQAGAWPVERIERALGQPERSPDLEALSAWLPAEELDELRELYALALEGRRRGGPRVYLLPGIMGSSLGLPRAGRDPDVLWMDLIDTFCGRLKLLSLKSGDKSVTSVGIRGILWRYYAKLQYRLQAHGFDVVVHDFDWRLSIQTMGLRLKERLLADPATNISLVCHSMGGLVGRAALKSGADVKVGRLVMLGTPNHGSFAPLQALRGTHSLVRLIALLDIGASKKAMVEKIFATFAGLYELIPAADAAGMDYFDPANWPARGLRPDSGLLARSRRIQDRLALPADPVPMHSVAGVNRETVVAAEVCADAFVYTRSNEGDGTVPLAFARLAGAETYYIEEEHGALPGNAAVAAAVADILRHGATDGLPRTWSPEVRTITRVDESQLRAEWATRTRPRDRNPETPVARQDVEAVLRPFLAAASREAVAAAAPAVSLNQVIVARQRQRRLDIELAHGDITAVPSRCYVLGIYQRVDPSTGAAGALDAALDHFISRMIERRMFTGRGGEMFVLPCGRRELRCDFVLLAGLGPYDRFDGEIQTMVAENVIATLAGVHIEEFCCVLLGDSSVQNRRDTLRNLMRGFLRGLEQADARHNFRRISLCEHDDARIAELRQVLLHEAAGQLFDNVQVTFSETRFAPRLPARGPAAVAAAPHLYLLVRLLEEQDEAEIQATVMGARSRAAIGLTRKRIAANRIGEALAPIRRDGFDLKAVEKIGRRLPVLLFTDELVRALKAEADPAAHLVLIHDAGASKIPWETLRLDLWQPAANGGMSRRYLATDLSMARWRPPCEAGKRLQVLLVVNPTQDLPGAEEEGRRIQAILGNRSAVGITTLSGRQATRQHLCRELASGRYDVMHYAGHGGFDAEDRTRSGLILAGGQWLTGQDVSGIRVLPPLIFFNACETARVRKTGQDHTGAFVGIAESLMRGGVANFIGTYWPVQDEAASLFAATFYGAVLAGEPLGRALAGARGALLAEGCADWGDYIHFGNPDFIIRQTEA